MLVFLSLDSSVSVYTHKNESLIQSRYRIHFLAHEETQLLTSFIITTNTWYQIFPSFNKFTAVSLQLYITGGKMYSDWKWQEYCGSIYTTKLPLSWGFKNSKILEKNQKISCVQLVPQLSSYHEKHSVFHLNLNIHLVTIKCSSVSLTANQLSGQYNEYESR